MSSTLLFQTHLVLGYVAWLLCFVTYVRPRLKAMDAVAVHRAIATLNSFRFFGLVFILPGVVSPDLPPYFANFAAYGDFATGLLAMLALMTVRVPRLFWSFTVAFNALGALDLVVDYWHAVQIDLPSHVGELLGATYWIPVLYVPALMISHGLAFSLLWRAPRRATA